MERFKQILKRAFFLPFLPTVLIAVPAFALVIFSLSTQAAGPIAYVSYAISAYALAICCTAAARLGTVIAAIRKKGGAHPAVKKLMEVPAVKRYFTDVRFKTEVSLYQGLLINLLYIALKLFSGIRYRSFWFIALAIYYAVLAVMRFLLVRRGRKRSDRTPMEEEIRRYRLCGIMLLLMNQALMGIVIYMVRDNRGFDYPGYLIYLMALYAFYAIITAVINVVKYRKHGSPILSAAKAISLVAAMISILSLTTAMLAQFGGDDTSNFRQIMTASVGGSICVIVIGMAVFMIWRSSKLKKELPINNPQIS